MRNFIFTIFKTTGSNRTGIWYNHLKVGEIVSGVNGSEIKHFGTFKYRTGSNYGDETEVKNFLAEHGYIDKKFGEHGEREFNYYNRYELERFGFTIEQF